MLGQFLHVLWNFQISRIGFYQVRGMTLLLQLFKDFSYQPKISWNDAQYNEADHYLWDLPNLIL